MSNNKLSPEDYSKKSKEIFKLLNDFRKNPSALIKHLENLKKYIDSKNILSEPGKIPVQMVEGKDAINEAIRYLREIDPQPPLIWDNNLGLSALEHVQDIGPKGLVSYQSSDGTEPEERISKYGNYIETLGENIDFGPNDAMGVIVSLTLDDGDEERPHRDNLFKSDYKKIGIACGSHKTEYQMCVMDFAFDFQPFEKEEDKGFSNGKNDSSNAGSHLAPNKSTNKNFVNDNFQEQTSNKNNYFEEPAAKNKNEVKQKDKQPQNALNGFKENANNAKLNQNNSNQSPLVKLSFDGEDQKPGFANKNEEDEIVSTVKNLNSGKKIVSKYVEITQKVVITFDDGSTKETVEKQNHKFNY